MGLASYSRAIGRERAHKPYESKNKPKVLQFPVHNVDYPRNRRIREYLVANGWDCQPISRGAGRETTLSEKVISVRSLLKAVGSADVIILSEMSLKYAPVTWLLSKIVGAIHVVDGFIGLYETDVEDKRSVPKNSLRAKLLKLQDTIAVRVADVYLVDTEIRAERIRAAHPRRCSVLSLPVGAPQWAKYQERSAVHSHDVLYYGNYIPLHGLTDYVQAIAGLPPHRRPATKMIGNGDCYDDIRTLVEQLGLSDFFQFHDPVPEEFLAQEISNSKVVLGIFGSSPKASSVIANKVWQGLASSRRVVTRQSIALDEISDLAGELLVQVPEGDTLQLGEAILRAVEGDMPRASSDMADRFECYVRGKFDIFLRLLSSRVAASQASPEVCRRRRK